MPMVHCWYFLHVTALGYVTHVYMYCTCTCTYIVVGETSIDTLDIYMYVRIHIPPHADSTVRVYIRVHVQCMVGKQRSLYAQERDSLEIEATDVQLLLWKQVTEHVTMDCTRIAMEHG